ncbi:MAG: class I SAM-dependent RNA methyltransferase [Puniceicoccaceae bacterium]
MHHRSPKNFIPEPFPYHHELELHISSMTNLGMGIGKWNDWVVMVPFVIPGERVRARIFRNHKNYSEADLLEVIDPSPDRTQPGCSYFGSCGGCQYQHLTYPAQLEIKRQHVAETLTKIAGIDTAIALPIHSEHAFHYRSKITPHHNKPRQGELGAMGFLKVGQRNQIVDIERCVIATEAINAELTVQRSERQALARKGRMKKGATLLLRDVMEGVITDPKKVVTERVGPRIFQFKAGDFFQNNPFVLPKMVDYVIDQAKQTGQPYLIDAYCGSGLFSICASHAFERCIGIEISESAIQWARANAALNQLKNCRFQVGDAKDIFESVDLPPAQCVLLIDPPRKGCDADFLDQVSRFKPGRMVYVSCDPATQARDLKRLLEMGYQVEQVQPVDLFPQTRHIENIVTLSLG